MKTMSKKIKSLLAWVMALMVVIVTAIPAWATTTTPSDTPPGSGWTEVASGSTAEVIIKGLTNGAKVNLYRVIETTYKDGSLSHKLVPDFETYLKNSNKLSGINASSSSEDVLKAYLALKSGNSSSNTGTNTTLEEIFSGYLSTERTSYQQSGEATNGQVTFSGVEMGQYIAKVTDAGTGETQIYQLVSVEVEPSVGDDGKYYIKDDYEVDIKSSPVTITKEVNGENKDTVSIGEKIPYKITFPVPVFGSDVTDKTIVITDTMGKGLTYNGDLVIKGNDNDQNIISGYKPVVTIGNNGETIITLTFNNTAYETLKNYESIILSYTATVNNEVVLGNNQIVNTAKITCDGKTVTDEVKHSTYAIVIDKYDGENGKKLTGAEFEIYDKNQVDSNGDLLPDAEPLDTVSTVSGSAIFDGLEKDIYYVKESKAPEEYAIDPTLHKIDLTGAQTPDKTVTFTRNYEYTRSLDEATTAGYPFQVRKDGRYGWYADSSDNVTFVNPGQEQSGWDPAYIKGITYSITKTENGGTQAYELKVENNKGPQLPSTGGTGRKIFYVGGAILMVGAGVIFVTRKRMERKNS